MLGMACCSGSRHAGVVSAEEVPAAAEAGESAVVDPQAPELSPEKNYSSKWQRSLTCNKPAVGQTIIGRSFYVKAE